MGFEDKNVIQLAENFVFRFYKRHLNCVKVVRDVRLPSQCKWDLRSSAMLRGVYIYIYTWKCVYIYIYIHEMSTRSISWGKGGRCVRLTNLRSSCAVVMKPGNLNFLEPSGPLQACNGTPLPLPGIIPRFVQPPSLVTTLTELSWLLSKV